MALRYYDKGSTFGVTVGEQEVYEFKRQWPASGLGRGPYFFEFDRRNGDLVDVQGPGASSYADGAALVALAEDAQRYGKCRSASPAAAGRCRRAFRRNWGGR